MQDRGFAVVRNAIARDSTNASTFDYLGICKMIVTRVEEHNARLLEGGVGEGGNGKGVGVTPQALDAKLLLQVAATAYALTCGALRGGFWMGVKILRTFFKIIFKY